MTAAALNMDMGGDGPSSDELKPGTKLLLGQFTIESFVNAGGFGIVYIARNSLDRRVVIKECFPSSYCRRIGTTVGASSRAQQDEFRSVVRLFLQEAVTLSQLRHPNIVKVHEVFEDNDTAYMAMDFVEGPDLLQTVEGEAPALTPEQITAFLSKMLDAVGYVHSQGVLHRDISPDNILLDKATGQPVLIDLGASRKETTRKSRALSGLRVVKDGYSPQEFYISGSTQAPFSDLYALAATFYHLIAGETPKTAQERLSSIASREGDPLRPLAGRFKAYPKSFLQAIDKAMSIFPRDRLQSVDEWRAMLKDGPALPSPQTVEIPVASEARAPANASSEAAVADLKVAVPEAKTVIESVADTARPASKPVLVPALALRGPRNMLVSSAAAFLLLGGLLSLPQDPLNRDLRANSLIAEAGSAADGLATAGSLDVLLVSSTLQLPGGLAFEAVETATGTQTVVAKVPDSAETDLEVGDVILVYAGTGETLGTSTALREILVREFANGVTSYDFVVRRGAITLDAGLRLEVAG
jgi:serine/threonine protein kinase